MIPWRPISELPDELKDGREVLVWSSGHNWSETHLVRYSPMRRYWQNDEGQIIDDITHFAEITPP